MNILFCHSGPVYCDVNNRFYASGFNDKLFQRYRRFFENISIVTRVKRSQEEYVGTDILSTDIYRVIEYPNYLTLKGFFASRAASDRMLEEEISKCDGLILRMPCSLSNRCANMARKYGKPCLIELVGCPWDALWTHSLAGKLLAPFVYWATKTQVKRASHVIYVTDEFLQKRYPTRGLQIGCSDVELQCNEECSAVKCKKTDPMHIVVGSIGKIDLRYKGHATVLEAIRILKKFGYNIQYQVVGGGSDGYLKDVAKRLGISENLVIVGPMSHDDIFTWFNNIDVYIQPSLTEGLPRALVEAMSMACPCIGSDVGGIPELLSREFIFKKGNARHLADIILHANENKLYESGERNRLFVDQFRPEVLSARREKFYEVFKAAIQEAK